MKKYRVVLALASGIKDVGLQIVNLYARTPFEAALEAEKLLDTYYKGNLYTHAKAVSEIPVSEKQNISVA